MKFVGISGDVVRPGIFEVPMGITYDELIYEYAGGIPDGKKLLGFAPSGPSSGYLAGFDDRSSAGLGRGCGRGIDGRIGSHRGVRRRPCMLDMALNATRFYRNESCGKCVPCRMGSQKMVEMLKGWTEGQSSKDDMQVLEELSTAMRLASICGLGQVVPVADRFRAETFSRGRRRPHRSRAAVPAEFAFTEPSEDAMTS